MKRFWKLKTGHYWIMAGVAAGVAVAADAAGTAENGAQLFRQCLACHSLQPGEHLTGPSLAGIVGKPAGTAEGFSRYSDALTKSGITWSVDTLDAWLRNPAALVPGNTMIFQGLAEAEARQDLVAYLEAASKADSGRQPARPRLADLKQLTPTEQVTALRYCGDAYYVTLATGDTYTFWEFNLRIKTDSSEYGPRPGEPAIVRASMRGDRAFVIFAHPAEISAFINHDCNGA